MKPGSGQSGRLAAALVVVATVCAADAPSARDRAKWQLAVRAAAREVLDRLEAVAEPEPNELDRLTTELSDAMQRNVGLHARVDASRKQSRRQLLQARRATIEGDIVPVTCGSAFRNKGVQPLLDTVMMASFALSMTALVQLAFTETQRATAWWIALAVGMGLAAMVKGFLH